MLLRLKRCILTLLLLFLSLLVLPVNTDAASGIKLSVETGFDGKLKSGHGFPMKITFLNKGKDFNGDLLINFYPSYNSNGAKAIHVDLPAGSTKTYHVSLPGLSEDQPFNQLNFQAIRLFEGSWENDREVDFAGPKKINPRFIDMMGKAVGILSENPDRLKELKVLSLGTHTEVLVLNDKNLPEDALGLDMIDYLVVDEFAISTLNDKQQQAIAGWIHNGGILIAGASPNISQSYGSLFELLPMKSGNEAFLPASFFKSTPEMKPDFNELPVFTGSLSKDAIVLEKNANIPVVVQKKEGSGQIWQTAFSLGDEPLSSWKGYGDWFEGLLSKTGSGKLKSFQGSPNPYEPLYYEFAEPNEYFSTLHFSITELALFMFAYLLVMIPFLYILLKKLDKREHAWWIIPLIALISSALIFGAGAKDRLASSKLNQMGVFLAENGRLNGIQAVTLLSNTGGSYKMSIKNGDFRGVPGGAMQNGEAQRYAVVEETRTANEITFPGVEYWSTRSYFGPASTKQKGQFSSNLNFENKRLTGEIKNDFPYDFEQLYVWSAGKKIKLGPLKSGDKVNVNQTIEQDFLTAPRSYQNNSYPGPQQDMELVKKQKLEYAAAELIYDGRQSNNSPVIFGFTKDAVIDVDLKDRKEKSNNIFLVFEPVAIKGKTNGPFTLKNEMLNTQVNVINGSIFEEINNSSGEIMIEDGEYEFTAQVPKQFLDDNAVLNELGINLRGENIRYSVFDYSSGKYFSLDDGQKSFIYTHEDARKFISEDGFIMIKMLKDAKGEPHVFLPSIAVRGEIKP